MTTKPERITRDHENTAQQQTPTAHVPQQGLKAATTAQEKTASKNPAAASSASTNAQQQTLAQKPESSRDIYVDWTQVQWVNENDEPTKETDTRMKISIELHPLTSEDSPTYKKELFERIRKVFLREDESRKAHGIPRYDIREITVARFKSVMSPPPRLSLKSLNPWKNGSELRTLFTEDFMKAFANVTKNYTQSPDPQTSIDPDLRVFKDDTLHAFYSKLIMLTGESESKDIEAWRRLAKQRNVHIRVNDIQTNKEFQEKFWTYVTPDKFREVRICQSLILLHRFLKYGIEFEGTYVPPSETPVPITAREQNPPTSSQMHSPALAPPAAREHQQIHQPSTSPSRSSLPPAIDQSWTAPNDTGEEASFLRLQSAHISYLGVLSFTCNERDVTVPEREELEAMKKRVTNLIKDRGDTFIQYIMIPDDDPTAKLPLFQKCYGEVERILVTFNDHNVVRVARGNISVNRDAEGNISAASDNARFICEYMTLLYQKWKLPGVDAAPTRSKPTSVMGHVIGLSVRDTNRGPVAFAHDVFDKTRSKLRSLRAATAEDQAADAIWGPGMEDEYVTKVNTVLSKGSPASMLTDVNRRVIVAFAFVAYCSRNDIRAHRKDADGSWGFRSYVLSVLAKFVKEQMERRSLQFQWNGHEESSGASVASRQFKRGPEESSSILDDPAYVRFVQEAIFSKPHAFCDALLLQDEAAFQVAVVFAFITYCIKADLPDVPDAQKKGFNDFVQTRLRQHLEGKFKAIGWTCNWFDGSPAPAAKSLQSPVQAAQEQVNANTAAQPNAHDKQADDPDGQVNKGDMDDKPVKQEQEQEQGNANTAAQPKAAGDQNDNQMDVNEQVVVKQVNEQVKQQVKQEQEQERTAAASDGNRNGNDGATPQPGNEGQGPAAPAAQQSKP